MALLALGGCSTSGQRIERAGAQLGTAEAGVHLPAWPAHCRQTVPHAPAAAGDDAIRVLKLERAQLDFANRRAGNCGAFYDNLKRGLSD